MEIFTRTDMLLLTGWITIICCAYMFFELQHRNKKKKE
jgi:hypothetical protein